jgi:hypothetical protein
MRRLVTVVPCPCAHKHCSTYHLRGIGEFAIGSGFTQDEAIMIARLVNYERAREELANGGTGSSDDN